VDEVQRLRFARWLVDAGRLGVDDTEAGPEALAAT
jgi:hypothetical protein